MAQDLTIKEMSEMAHVMGRSGLFGKKPDEILSLMFLANAQGQHPAIVAMEYDVIQGRPALKTTSAQSRFQMSGGKIQWLERSDVKASAKFYHEAGGELVITWTIDRAKQAGLAGKDMWKKYPAQMLSARVMAEGVRAVYPACLSGFYTSEEVKDFSDTTPAQITQIAKNQTPIETTVEVIDEDVRDAMSDQLDSRIEKMLDYMEKAGVTEEELLEFLGKTHCTHIDEADILRLGDLVKECSKMSAASGESLNDVITRQFKKEDK